MSKGCVACLLVGGPTYYMPGVQGHNWPFEMHPYMGPCPLTLKRHEETDRVPSGFWKQWSLFDRGGRRMNGTLCVVPTECRECLGGGVKLHRLCGQHYQFEGECEACRGKGVVFADEAGGKA